MWKINYRAFLVLLLVYFVQCTALCVRAGSVGNYFFNGATAACRTAGISSFNTMRVKPFVGYQRAFSQQSHQKNYYDLLRIASDADQAAIKKAYRKLAMKYHPDHNPGDKFAEERFKELSRAYRTLSDTDLRDKYDQAIKHALYQTKSKKHAYGGEPYRSAAGGSVHNDPAQAGASKSGRDNFVYQYYRQWNKSYGPFFKEYYESIKGAWPFLSLLAGAGVGSYFWDVNSQNNVAGRGMILPLVGSSATDAKNQQGPTPLYPATKDGQKVPLIIKGSPLFNDRIYHNSDSASSKKQ